MLNALCSARVNSGVRCFSYKLEAINDKDDLMQFLTNSNFWSILASIATVLGFAVVSYTAIIALGQLKEMTKARHLEAMLQVYEMIGSESARKHRKFIYTELKSAPEALTP